MFYCLVEKTKHGNKQINRIALPISLILHGWESTRLLYESGKISKDIAGKYKYITNYEPEDWEDEEQLLHIKKHGEYILS